LPPFPQTRIYTCQDNTIKMIHQPKDQMTPKCCGMHVRQLSDMALDIHLNAIHGNGKANAATPNMLCVEVVPSEELQLRRIGNNDAEQIPLFRALNPVPAEGQQAPQSGQKFRTILVLHFQFSRGQQPHRHSHPFITYICEGDTEKTVRQRVLSRMNVSEETFSKWRLYSFYPDGRNPETHALGGEDEQDGQAAKGRRGQADGDEDEQNRPPQGQDGYDDEAADQANADLFYNEYLFPVDDDDDRQYGNRGYNRNSRQNPRIVYLGIAHPDPNPTPSSRRYETGIKIRD